MTPNTLDHLKTESIRDVVRILDSAVLRGNELVQSYRAMQIANRAFLAHTAIEKGLKDRLTKAGISYPKTGPKAHDLPSLYELTQQIDNGAWADSLEDAFKDAVRFYEYDLKLVPHVETLKRYLGATGSHEDFIKMRYWLEDDSTAEAVVVQMHNISLALHREILEALQHLVGYDRKRLVSERVERVVGRALQSVLSYGVGTPDEQACNELLRWLETKSSCRDALREAVRLSYAVEGVEELGRQKLRQAFEGLDRPPQGPSLFPSLPPSADPAVGFYIVTCRDLPSGYPFPHADAEAEIRWLDDDHITCEVLTPAGDVLGFISRSAQGRWHMDALTNQAGIYSRSFEDVKRALVAQHCQQVTVVTDDETAQRYIFSSDPSTGTIRWMRAEDDSARDPLNTLDRPDNLELHFWDWTHNLEPEQLVTITQRFNEESRVGDRFNGVVTKVEGHRVWLAGHHVIDLV